MVGKEEMKAIRHAQWLDSSPVPQSLPPSHSGRPSRFPRILEGPSVHVDNRVSTNTRAVISNQHLLQGGRAPDTVGRRSVEFPTAHGT